MQLYKEIYDFQNGEILNFCKPENWSSFDVVKKVRRLIGIKKVGHCGTLDPFATGVLLICTGRATKRSQEYMALEKEYVGEIELGRTTDTLDSTGNIIHQAPAAAITESQFKNACSQFFGEIEQVPPMHSAIQLNGVRLYKLARKGQQIDLPPRRVHVYSIDVLDFTLPIAKIKVVCSKGTYIRALARDIGDFLGCGAHLKSLCRSKIGNYSIADAWSIQEFQEYIFGLKTAQVL
ncbi:tRNA pseudouridine(55) synthase TruB [candidate division KSB1 bacterium]|nr:tRNA pseudouridine(55) synthase TruB [candidate division KSB1 bacterium]